MGAWRVIHSRELTSSPPPGPPPATMKWRESMDSQPQNSQNSVYSERSSASGSLDLLLGSKVQSHHQSLTSRMVNLDSEIERFSDTSTTFKNAEFRRPSSIHASSSSSATTTIIVSSNNDTTYQPGTYKQPKDQPESYHQRLLYPTRFDIFLNFFSARSIWFVVVTFDFCHVSAWYGCGVVDTGLVGQWKGVGEQGGRGC